MNNKKSEIIEPECSMTIRMNRPLSNEVKIAAIRRDLTANALAVTLLQYGIAHLDEALQAIAPDSLAEGRGR